MEPYVLVIGLLAGVSHAFEPDHMAAVAAMAAKRSSPRAMVARGAAWGLGHTITLSVISSAVILFGMTLSIQRAALLESCVGVMLVLLGAEVAWRIRERNVHLPLHTHGDAGSDCYGRNHRTAGEHSPEGSPMNGHWFPFKAMGVGLVHGAAGSGALSALVIATIRDPAVAMGYVLNFGIGSIGGMASLSFAASWPLQRVQNLARDRFQLLQAILAGLAIAMGVLILLTKVPVVLRGA